MDGWSGEWTGLAGMKKEWCFWGVSGKGGYMAGVYGSVQAQTGRRTSKQIT